MSAAQRDSVRMSYEFALNHVGQDKDSGQIWADYIQFLKSGEVRRLPICLYPPLTFVLGDNNMGAAAADGLAPQGVPSRGTDSPG